VTGHRTQYILDTNVFIQAKNDYYAFDICPGFWTALKRHGKIGNVVSIDRVHDEIEKGHDRLSTWVRGVDPGFFKQTGDQRVIAEYGALVAWAQTQPQFTGTAKNEFMQTDNADPWVVAYAKVNGCVVVTHEVLEPDIKKKVKIPNVCQAVGVSYLNTFDMLRVLRIKFISSTKKHPPQ
jgi:hypothetical protein